MKVLVADDSATSRVLLRSALRRWGYDVVVVEDGLQAWGTLMQPNAPRLAILDWDLPKMTAVEVCERIREARKPYTYILLLTTMHTKHETEEGIKAGADDVIVKPWDELKLEVRVRAGRRIIDSR